MNIIYLVTVVVILSALLLIVFSVPGLNRYYADCDKAGGVVIQSHTGVRFCVKKESIIEIEIKNKGKE